jgi:glutaminase
MENACLESMRPLDAVVLSIADQVRQEQSGEVATYIPELSTANPDWFGMCVATADGAVYRSGESRQPFTIQSISKPFVYTMALQHCGEELVRARVGVEPSGEAFNSISLEPGTGRPLNPMINAGAIAVSSLIYQKYREKSLSKVLHWFEAFTGRPMEIDQKVYESESRTGHRNRAIAHLLRNFGIVGDPVEEGVELYFKQCSILVTAEDLAMMAATLANRGVNPLTDTHAMPLDLVDDMLSVMTTCGMYDYAGQWLYDVGLPAKSGVAGGVLAVLPGRLGIGVFSPKLDAHGNSVRGVKACQELSRRFRLHLFSAGRPASSAVRRHLTLKRRHSRHVRSLADAARIKELGDCAHLFELQGDLQFSGIEAAQRAVWRHLPKARYVVLDFARVDSLDDVAMDGLRSLIEGIADRGVQVALSSWLPHRLPELGDLESSRSIWIHEDLESAIEACEDDLLAGPSSDAAPGHRPHGVLAPGELELASRLTPDEVRVLEAFLTRIEYEPETPLFRQGDPSSHLYFLALGVVAVRLTTAAGPHRCVARLGPGSVLGEMSAIDRGTRSSDVWSQTHVVCYAMSVADYDRLSAEHPLIKIKMLEYLLGVLTHRLRSANDQIAALAH